MTHQGQEIAVLRHEPALLDRPDLLRSVLEAASLAIEIARLRVEVRLQLAEVEESRARVVRAGYEERRRLERDLHDGAQQRLVTLGIVLRRLQRSLPREAQILAPALDSAVDEIGSAIEDLRTIAAGVRPPRLDEGLAPALADLARAAPVPVDVRRDRRAAARRGRGGRLLRRLRGGHQRRQARVPLARSRRSDASMSGALQIGRRRRRRRRGDASRAGTGLSGLTDRVEAQGGTLLIHSPPGAGTRIEAEIPCGS